MLSDETFYQEIQPEWREAVKRIARGEPDRTDRMKGLDAARGEPPTVHAIMAAVAYVTGWSASAMKGSSVTPALARARTLVVLFTLEHRPDLSHTMIANHLKKDRALIKKCLDRAATLQQDAQFLAWQEQVGRRLGRP